MNILIDVGHPAHVHLFANAANIWKEHNHQVLFTIRNRKMVPELLQALQFQYEIASTPRSGLFGQAWELAEHDWNVLRYAIRFKANVLIGTSVSIAHVSKIINARSIIFSEDDADYAIPFKYLAYPFADGIVVPSSLRDKKTSKYHTYEGYQELAYLHPNRFTPDPNIFKELGLSKHENFFVLRLISFKAYHDGGHKGLSRDAKHRIIKLLSKHGRVFISDEGEINDEFRQYQFPIPPHRIHHALYYATMLISDGQTMTAEAAVLGTPAIRCSTHLGWESYIEELEKKYGLVYSFLPDDEEAMISKISEILEIPDMKSEWANRRDKMLSEKIDLTPWMVDLVENFV
jgi:predicted glycosyltransferase